MASSRAAAASAARLVLVERRDTVASRNPYAKPVRRYRLARTQLTARPAPSEGRRASGRTSDARPRGRTLPCMEEKSTSSSFGMRVLAALVLALAAWFLLKVIIGIVAGVAWFVAVVVAVVAVIWAARTLF